MPIGTPVGNLDIANATLRTSNLETQNIKIGSIFVNSYPGLETTANVGNSMSNTIQFTNTHTAFTTTGNVTVGKELTVSGNATFSGTGALTVPSGTTAEQPTGVAGMIRYNSTTGYMESYTASGWGALATPPSITSISPTSLAVADTATQVFTVSGSVFDSGLAINLVGADGTNYSVVDPTFVNAATVTFKMGDLSSATAQVANRPYKVKITGGSDLATTSIQTIGFSGISWTSPAAGATLTYIIGVNSTQNLVATDDTGGNDVTFSIVSGSVSGLGLNSQTSSPATYGGSASGTSATVIFRVTDNVSGSTLDRTFSIVATSSLYTFNTGTSHTFTNAGKTGKDGPTITNCINTYGNSSPWNEPNFFNVSNGIQQWKVPATGTYRITATGARERVTNSSGQEVTGGQGAYMRGDFSLTIGEVIHILVGQEPTGGTAPDEYGQTTGNGGAGGSFVIRSPYNTTASILVIAGGAGGSTGTGFGQYTGNGTGYGTVSHGRTQTDGGNAQDGGGYASPYNDLKYTYGGTGGAGGDAGDSGSNYNGGGGGGFSGNGERVELGQGGSGKLDSGGKSFTNGGTGGTGTHYYLRGVGGFGGGGAGGWAAGGGGGYSGGAGVYSRGNATDKHQPGGGGGSYNSGSNQSNSTPYSTGHGFVTIERLT